MPTDHSGPGSDIDIANLAAPGENEAPNERQVGWHADPFGRHQKRWWDGRRWSEKIRSDDGRGIDPPGIDRAPVTIPRPIPATPIEDAVLPIKRPKIADKIALAIGCLVFLALVAVFVVALTTQA